MRTMEESPLPSIIFSKYKGQSDIFTHVCILKQVESVLILKMKSIETHLIFLFFVGLGSQKI